MTKPTYKSTDKLCPVCRKDYLWQRTDKPPSELASIHECFWCLKEHQRKTNMPLWHSDDDRRDDRDR